VTCDAESMQSRSCLFTVSSPIRFLCLQFQLSDSDNDDNEGDGIGDWEEDKDGEESDDNGNGDGIENEYVDKFIHTFHKGDYDQEFDNTLSFDRTVTLLAMPTQASYIKPNNWRERNQIGLEKMKEQLQPRIHSVLHNFMLKLTQNDEREQQLMDDEEPIVWYEPILDEYWNHIGTK